MLLAIVPRFALAPGDPRDVNSNLRRLSRVDWLFVTVAVASAGLLATVLGAAAMLSVPVGVLRGVLIAGLAYAATYGGLRAVGRNPLDAVLAAGGLLVIGISVMGAVNTLVAGTYTPREWARFTVAGLTQGSIYALIALGYTLVYGILRMINFAHGEVFTGGAMSAYFLADALHRTGFLAAHPFVSIAGLIALAAGVSMAIAVLLERIAYRPLRGAPRLVPLITAIGASFFLQYTYRGLFGTGIKTYKDVPALGGSIQLGPLAVGRGDALVITAAMTLMALLYTFVQRTRVGMAMRAVSEDKQAAALMGIDVDRVIVTTFAIGGALAGAAGVLYALVFRQTQFFMGFVPGLKAFTAAVLGGIGNIPGAMVGGLFLGIVESVAPFLILDGLDLPSPNQLKDAIAFTMLVLVLIFRPTGILGERVTKRA